MVKITDESPDENRYYPLTVDDIDAGFAADNAWDSNIIDLTKIDQRATVSGAGKAGELAIDTMLDTLFPTNDSDGSDDLRQAS